MDPDEVIRRMHEILELQAELRAPWARAARNAAIGMGRQRGLNFVQMAQALGMPGDSVRRIERRAQGK